ncbi:glycosyltransferase family 4 protein [Thermophilibacter immobilis]|uniref:Glycosyltransferase family 4 protein n=1 Tax=Thermophilibacter immobilis TaxID=2779519 RepID=A0A7S7RVJ6_9ACTN|nr:glycosyltransferase family 4 protein [Thermophilibacter immobilis]QOY61384.1 glycosyltransferase family 4 protein [Thermophilibacter immobilis]
MPQKKSYALFSAQYPPHLGGIETFTEHLAQALVAQGADVTVVTNDTNGVGAGITCERGVEVIRLPCAPLIGGRFPLHVHNRVFRDLDAQIRVRRWDGVLANARFYPHSLYGMKLARSVGVRPVLLDHGSAYLSFSNPVLDPFVRVYERGVTAWGKRRYDPAYYGISSKSVEWLKKFGIEAKGVIGNSIDARAYRESSSVRDFRGELDLEDSFVVASVGRLIPEKGIAALIEASRSLELRARGVVFVLAGDGPMADGVRMAQGEGLRWVGRLESPDVSALLQQADVMCLPTRSEGFSTTLLEASACGCPSIVTDVGGARELIPDESYGTILESASSAGVTRAIARLFDHPNAVAEQRINCGRRAEDLFSWEATAQSLMRVWEDLAERPPKGE